MDGTAAALGEGARWRIVELLAERPRSVGELAELAGLRQPQTTKHLQTLAKAGLVTVFPLGQRRVYALEQAPLTALAARLGELAAATQAHQAEREVLTRYRGAIETETAAADRDRWADGREFTFERLLIAPVSEVWRHWTEPDLLAGWWAPPAFTVTACALEPRAGGRALLVYRDAEGQTYRSEGEVTAAAGSSHLAFHLSVLDQAGEVSFTGHYDLRLAEVPEGTGLRLTLRITDTAVAAVPFVAGIGTGWGQVLDHLAEAVSVHTPLPPKRKKQS